MDGKAGKGPLAGVRIVEFAGIGPGPLAAMILADLGAELLRIERLESQRIGIDRSEEHDFALRGRAGAIGVNLKCEEGRAFVLDRLGHAGGPPSAPINFLGDYAGGSLLTIVGMLAAVLSARQTGTGQVVDAAMIDGVSLLAVPLLGLVEAGIHGQTRGRNLLDGGAPHYNVYPCADGRYLSIAPIEAKFHTLLLEGLGFDPAIFPDVARRENWPEARRLLAGRIASRPLDHWLSVFEGSDACVAPVLDFKEAMAHPHNLARAAHVEIDGYTQPPPTPRFSVTAPNLPSGPSHRRDKGDAALIAWGMKQERLAALRQAAVIS